MRMTTPIDESQSQHSDPTRFTNDNLERRYELWQTEQEVRASLRQQAQGAQPSIISELQAENQRLKLELAKIENRHQSLLQEGSEILIKHEELKKENQRLKNGNSRLRMMGSGQVSVRRLLSWVQGVWAWKVHLPLLNGGNQQ